MADTRMIFKVQYISTTKTQKQAEARIRELLGQETGDVVRIKVSGAWVD